jgi:hypothetical protein
MVISPSLLRAMQGPFGMIGGLEKVENVDMK